MNPIYDLYYETKCGELIFCQTFTCEKQVEAEAWALSQEFPHHDYWWETIYADEQEG